jgi:hypothetical protein
VNYIILSETADRRYRYVMRHTMRSWSGFGNAVGIGRLSSGSNRGLRKRGESGKRLGRRPVSREMVMRILFSFSLPSFAGGIAGITSGLPLGFLDGFPCGPLSEFRIAGLLLGFQRGLTSGSLGDLRSG